MYRERLRLGVRGGIRASWFVDGPEAPDPNWFHDGPTHLFGAHSTASHARQEITCVAHEPSHRYSITLVARLKVSRRAAELRQEPPQFPPSAGEFARKNLPQQTEGHLSRVEAGGQLARAILARLIAFPCARVRVYQFSAGVAPGSEDNAGGKEATQLGIRPVLGNEFAISGVGIRKRPTLRNHGQSSISAGTSTSAREVLFG